MQNKVSAAVFRARVMPTLKSKHLVNKSPSRLRLFQDPQEYKKTTDCLCSSVSLSSNNIPAW